MLYYERIDTSEGTNPTKSNKSRECMICYYWFFNHEFKFQDYICNGCHDLTKLSVNCSLFRTVFFYIFSLVYTKCLILWTPISL